MKHKLAARIILSIVLLIALLEALLAFVSAGFNQQASGKTDKSSLTATLIALGVVALCVLGLVIISKKSRKKDLSK